MSVEDVPTTYVTVDFGSVELPIEETDGAHNSRPSDPIAQWMGVVRATMDAQRSKQNVKEHKNIALQEIVGTPVNLDFLNNSQGRGSANNASPQHSDSTQAQDDSCGIPVGSPRKKNPEVSELPQRQDHAKNCNEEKQLKNLMVVQNILVQQLNSFGVGLTLLVAVTAVAILQPPGSFDSEGHIKPCSLVACFLFFSSLSFLLACCGLVAVIVGSASLFRPWFLPDFEDLKNLKDMEAGTRDGVVRYDDISTLGNVILDNIRRVRRIRIYLISSLGLCMLAFVCGAFAILGSAKCSRYLAIGTICGGGLLLAVEIRMTFVGPSRLLDTVATHHLCTVKTSQLDQTQTHECASVQCDQEEDGTRTRGCSHIRENVDSPEGR